MLQTTKSSFCSNTYLLVNNFVLLFVEAFEVTLLLIYFAGFSVCTGPTQESVELLI